MTAEISLIVAGVFALLAIVAWAASWKTLEWLGDAEDLLERMQRGATAWGELDEYKRRTPRRRSS